MELIIEKASQRVLFEKMCDLIIILSIFATIYGLYQFNQISIANGRTFLEFHIFNSPKRRITSTFMNANIYAMVIDFVCVMCMYRFVKNDNIFCKIGYFIVALFNFFVLYLTGSRTALLPFVLIFPIFFILRSLEEIIYYISCIGVVCMWLGVFKTNVDS